jgi:hypothetical protein
VGVLWVVVVVSRAFPGGEKEKAVGRVVVVKLRYRHLGCAEKKFLSGGDDGMRGRAQNSRWEEEWREREGEEIARVCD